MNQVWLFFKLLELLLDCSCMSIHIAGSLNSAEPQPHNLIFCATFAGITLLSGIRCIRLITGQRTLLHPELFITASGMLMHFICALLAMHYAEYDFHLIYMGPQEELEHVYFGFSKMQSVACIVTGAVFLLQAILSCQKS